MIQLLNRRLEGKTRMILIMIIQIHTNHLIRHLILIKDSEIVGKVDRKISASKRKVDLDQKLHQTQTQTRIVQALIGNITKANLN